MAGQSLADLEQISFAAATGLNAAQTSLADKQLAFFMANSGLTGKHSIDTNSQAFFKANNGAVGSSVVETERAYYDAKEATGITLVNLQDKRFNYFTRHGVYNA